MKAILVGQYPELACRCPAAVETACDACGAALMSHGEEISATGPEAEVLCARCYLIVAAVRKLPPQHPGITAALERAVALHMSLN